MKILFTGASSFTGFWFVKTLTEKGHEVVAIFQKQLSDYQSVRRARIDLLLPLCDCQFNCSLGSQTFFDLIQQHKKWDLFCHHAADASQYKSGNFDPLKALANNTKAIPEIVALLRKKECKRVILTGSYFEKRSDFSDVSAYALSKTLTHHYFDHYTKKEGIELGSFVIPNPFGPYEEAKFTHYLIQSWINKKVPTVKTPDYIRDNIHVELLARAYLAFVERPGKNAFYPSGYVESQGAFAKRVSTEISKRLKIPCPFTLLKQEDFSEPISRFNRHSINFSDWNENKGWNALANYYS